jgi:hypothetical protein
MQEIRGRGVFNRMDAVDPAPKSAEEFGSGLRAHLARRDEPVEEPRPENVAWQPRSAPTPTATASVPSPEELQLAAAEIEERSARLTQLQADLESRERRLAEETAALNAAARLNAPSPAAEPERNAAPRPAADALRERLETRIDLLWRTFEQSLDATHADGTPDYRTRLDAARMLLGAAYPGAAPTDSTPAADDERLEDELARLRDRRVEWGQGS